ncbi:hypothetical protein C8R44DRAFT_541939, partial [Mycena epipterygia]
GTFTVCNTKGCSATFSFNGTQVWIYGSKRDNHGPYSVKMDGNTMEYDGFSADDEYTSLFDSGSLKQGQHTVVITNIMKDTKRPYIDIDYASHSAALSALHALTSPRSLVAPNITLKDTVSQFSYQPSDNWKTNLPDDILTQEQNASAIISFSVCPSSISHQFRSFAQGDTVAIFGAVGPSLGPYDIKIDGQSMGTFNATKQNYAAQIQLYHADDLGAGNHTLEIVNQPTSTGQGLAIDFARVAGL